MKQVILMSLIIGVVAGPTFADYFAPAVSGMSWLGDAADTDTLGVMMNQVGSWMQIDGQLKHVDGSGNSVDGIASTQFGVSYNGLDLSGYEGYQLYFANINDDDWKASLYITTFDGTNYNTTTTAWTDLVKPGSSGTPAPGSYGWVQLDFTTLGVSNTDSVTGLGFWIGGYMDGFPFIPNGDYPSNPDHFTLAVAPVPVPATILLGLLGLGVGGWKLRRSL